MEDFGNKLWVWGYVMDKIPGFVPFVNEPTSCSLETACRYLGADNAVFMNSMHDIDALDDGLFSHLRDRKNVVCALTHGKYAESAERISAFSLTHPNVCGAVLDDLGACFAIRLLIQRRHQRPKLFQREVFIRLA